MLNQVGCNDKLMCIRFGILFEDDAALTSVLKNLDWPMHMDAQTFEVPPVVQLKSDTM